MPSEYVHAGGVGAATPACLTVNVCPAIVTAPVRASPLLALTCSRTEPFPDPLAPDETVTQLTLLVVVHVQPLAAVTATVAVPPPLSTD